MAEIINFSHEEEMPDLDGMSRDQLLAWLREIREQILPLIDGDVRNVYDSFIQQY